LGSIDIAVEAPWFSLSLTGEGLGMTNLCIVGKAWFEAE